MHLILILLTRIRTDGCCFLTFLSFAVPMQWFLLTVQILVFILVASAQLGLLDVVCDNKDALVSFCMALGVLLFWISKPLRPTAPALAQRRSHNACGFASTPSSWNKLYHFYLAAESP